jgi:hypothetical protein
LSIEIRSKEENRKKYRVLDVKIVEREKRWENLNSFLNIPEILMQNVQIQVGLSWWASFST